MFRDRTNLYLAYRKTFPHNLHKSDVRKPLNNDERFNSLRQEEEGLLNTDDAGAGIELDDFQNNTGTYDEYTNLIQGIENKGNDLTERIKQNMKQLSKKYKEVLLPQFDDDIVQSEMAIVNELSNRITDELRMIYKVINELQKLDEVLIVQQEKSSKYYSDNNKLNNSNGTRILISNLKKKFALISQELSGEFREMQGKYIKYLKKDEFDNSNSGNDIESYSRNAMVESSKQIESTQTQLQVNKTELIDDQQYLLEREREIYKISQNVVEISIIFKELENIVIDQGTILDSIEYNLDRTTENVNDAHKQLNKAESYQKQTRKCKIVLFLILLIILLLMILMVKPRRVDHYVHDSVPSNNNNNNNNNDDINTGNDQIMANTEQNDEIQKIQNGETTEGAVSSEQTEQSHGITVSTTLFNGAKIHNGGHDGHEIEQNHGFTVGTTLLNSGKIHDSDSTNLL